MENSVTFTLEEHVLDEREKMMVKPFHQDDTVPHNHSFFEMVYVTGGMAVHTLNGTEEQVCQGDYFIIDYGSIHSYTNCRQFELINCLFLPEVIDETLTDSRSFDEILKVCLIRYYRQYLGLTPANRIFHDEDGRIFALIQGIQAEYDRKEVGYMEIFRCRLQEILILTMRKIVDEKKSRRIKENQQSKATLLLIQYLKEHYKERTVLTHFCQEYHYSLQYISRHFKQETGMSVSDYLQKLRIEKSCELLAGSDCSIQEAARAVGYEDVKFFNQLFRRYLHMPPREYRKMTRLFTGTK